MKTKWYITALIVLTLLLLFPVQRQASADEAASDAAAISAYPLTDSLQVEVKSILNERTSDGIRLGAVVRVYNQSGQIARIPEYELKVVTDDGIAYSLLPSMANVQAIQPKENTELSYMTLVNRDDDFALSGLEWADVNDTAYYPRREKTMLSIPIQSLEWKGPWTDLSSTAAHRYWGMPFIVPVISSTLQFKPIHYLEQNTAQGPAALITLLVENKGQREQTVPNFQIDGNSISKVYSGKRLEAGAVTVGAGETKALHYAIPLDNHAELKYLHVLTTETFVAEDKTKVEYGIGWVQIDLPDGGFEKHVPGSVEAYDPDKPIAFDPLNALVSPDINVYLADLHMLQGEDNGYNVAVASFRLQNRSMIPAAVPNFMAQLVSADGVTYLGSRQDGVIQSMIPNISYVVNYLFIVPITESGIPVTMELLDGDSAAPYRLPIAAFSTQVNMADNQLSVYPFQAKINSWLIDSTPVVNGNTTTYKYNLRMNLDVTRADNAIPGQNGAKLKLELVNDRGELLDTQVLPFTGENRLVSGDRVVTFNSDKSSYPFIINMYESLMTPYGETKRLLKTLRQ